LVVRFSRPDLLSASNYTGAARHQNRSSEFGLFFERSGRNGWTKALAICVFWYSLAGGSPYAATRVPEVGTARCFEPAVALCAPAQDHRHSDRQLKGGSRNREDGSGVESGDGDYAPGRRRFGH